jgi:F-type H+-transporting ATPase subunit gamma
LQRGRIERGVGKNFLHIVVVFERLDEIDQLLGTCPANISFYFGHEGKFVGSRIAEFLRERRDKKLSLVPVGKKGRDSLKRAGFKFTAEYINVLAKVEFSAAREIAGLASELYAKEEIDAVYLIFSEFKNVVTANLKVEKLLPVEPEMAGEPAKETAQESSTDQPQSRIDYLYEQPVDKLLASLLPKYIESEMLSI